MNTNEGVVEIIQKHEDEIARLKKKHTILNRMLLISDVCLVITLSALFFLILY